MDAEALKSAKRIRPAYDVLTQAPNQPMYSGGFRPNVHENAPYPRNSRQLEQDVPWQKDGDQMYVKVKKRDEDGLDTSRQNTSYGDKHSPRKSRSPIRRDRSPIRDRYRRHSPSSPSPRRSWAFEKRRSPEAREAPPPPNWPGQDIRDDGRFKPASDRKEDNSKHVPSWDKPAFTKDEDGKRRDEKLKPYVGPSKVFHGDFGNKIDTPRGELYTKHQRDPKFGARDVFENRGGYRQTTNDESKPYLKKQDLDYHHSAERENTRRLGESRRKESPSRGEGKSNNFKTLDKDIESIYKRAQEFKKKAEEVRKSERRMKEHSEERGRTARILEEKERQDQTTASTRRIDNTPRHHMDDSPPRRRMNDSPRRRVNDSPRRRMDDSPRRRMDDSPLRRMDNSPRRRPDGSPRRRIDNSPQRRIDDSPRQSRSDTEHRRRSELHTKVSPSREPIWKAVDKTRKLFAGLPAHVKVKRDKAAEEISDKLLSTKPIVHDLTGQGRHRVMEELKKTVSHKLSELFDVQDVSFIELVIKFQSRVSDKEKDKIFDDVIKSLPARFRKWNTLGADSSNAPHKKPRLFTDHRFTEESPGGPSRKSKRSPERQMKEKSSDVPHKKSKQSPENKIKDATASQPSQGGIYKKKKQPVNPEKSSHIENLKMLYTKRALMKHKDLKKNNTSTKTIKKDVSSSDSNAKVQKEKKVELKSTPAETPTVPVKLDALTTKIVESELQDIMIKIWQQLPDEPTDEAEELVVDKFRNNAGDSLRNILGLNVTKRLLNVFNSLYVKLEFSSVPKRDDVIKMMRKYNMKGLKRIQRTPVIFGAYVNTIEDFDIICSEKSITCGPVKVSVISVYKFDKCPKNLITNFDDKEISDDDISDINKIINKSPIQETKVPEKESKQDIKIEKEESPKMKNKTIEGKPKVEQKPLEKPVNENLKKSSDDIQTSNKVSDPKPQRKKEKPVKKIINKKTTTEETKVEVKKKVEKTEPTKFKDGSAIKNVFIEGNDFDELDDDTILALMSEGIVVDECSGSE